MPAKGMTRRQSSSDRASDIVMERPPQKGGLFPQKGGLFGNSSQLFGICGNKVTEMS